MLQFKSSPSETSPGTLTASLASMPDTFPRSPDFHPHPSPRQGNTLAQTVIKLAPLRAGLDQQKGQDQFEFSFSSFFDHKTGIQI